jgi:hypothetical protein
MISIYDAILLSKNLRSIRPQPNQIRIARFPRDVMNSLVLPSMALRYVCGTKPARLCLRPEAETLSEVEGDRVAARESNGPSAVCLLAFRLPDDPITRSPDPMSRSLLRKGTSHAFGIVSEAWQPDCIPVIAS